MRFGMGVGPGVAPRGLSLPSRVKSILKKFGSDAHLYTFGPGVPILGPELVSGSALGVAPWGAPASGTVAGGVWSGMSLYAGYTIPVTLVVGKRYRLRGAGTSTGFLGFYSGIGANYGNFSTVFDFEFVASWDQIVLQSNTAGQSVSITEFHLQEILGYSNTYSGFVAGNYFDSAGATHASVDGSVGLVLDAAGSVGPELITNGGPFVDTTGWTGAGDVTTVAAGGNLVLTNNSTLYGNAGFSLPTVPNATYKLVMRLASVSHGQATQVMIGNSQGSPDLANPQFASVGEKSIHFKAQNATTHITVFTGDNTAGHAAQWSLISVCEVTGIHATQGTPGYKPTLRKGIVNLLRGSNDRQYAAWFGSGVVVNSSASLTLSEYGYQTQGVAGPVAGETYTHAVVLSGVPGSTISINVQDNSGTWAQTNQTVTLTATPTIYTVSRTLGADGALAGITSFEGVTTVEVGPAGLFKGTLTAAQILAAGGIPMTTTAPASSQAGLNYLEFDGVDDRLSFGNPNITTAATIVWSGLIATDSVPQFPIGQPGGGLSIWYVGGYLITGNYAAQQMAASYSIDTTKPVVITVVVNIGGSSKLRVNGVQVAESAVLTTAFNQTTMTLMSTGAGDYFCKGKLNFAAVFNSALQLADVQLLEKQAAAAAGIQL